MDSAGSAPTYTFAYYCSGHGYGHATRVVALTHELLSRSHRVHICTNAPEYVFNTAVASGAQYRHAEIDAGIVQPKAYDVARKQTIDGLKAFLDKREDRILQEVDWLRSIRADAVLVDAPFLPCAAAKVAGIPSIIISNFTFDSCYSYLSVPAQAEHASLPASPISSTSTSASASLSDLTAIVSDSDSDATRVALASLDLNEDKNVPEQPIAAEILDPLVNQTIRDYANASLLLRLPGSIPIPAFDLDVPLPAPLWTDLKSHSFNEPIMDLLARDPSQIPCNSSNGIVQLSHDDSEGRTTTKRRRRKAVQVPLITRPVSEDIYTKEAREKLLTSLGVPTSQQDPTTTRILVVSFGGQSIPRPSSHPPSPVARPSNGFSEGSGGHTNGTSTPASTSPVFEKNGALSPPMQLSFSNEKRLYGGLGSDPRSSGMQRVMTEEHLYLPGAPPTLHQNHRRMRSGAKGHTRKISLTGSTVFPPATPSPTSTEHPVPPQDHTSTLDYEVEVNDENVDQLLPPGWIAIVCGLSSKDLEEELPPNFYAAPRDCYLPDLTATCDVLLGKLGYGTCSETVHTQTPFIYVPRPLFVEEFGLKRLMETSGTSLPMSRADFEAGRWASLVTTAWEMGRERKAAHRRAHIDRKEPQVKASTVIAQELERFMASED